MDKNKLISLIEFVILLLILLTSIILLIALDPTTTKSYKIFIMLIYMVIPIVHLIFIVIKLSLKVNFIQKTYDEAYMSITLVFAVLMTYLLDSLNHFKTYFYIYYIVLIIPILLAVLFYFLAKKKDQQIKEKALKQKLTKN